MFLDISYKRPVDSPAGTKVGELFDRHICGRGGELDKLSEVFKRNRLRCVRVRTAVHTVALEQILNMAFMVSL